MRILIVTHYFPPEIGAPQSRLSDLARFWAMAGDEVTVLTGMPNHPTGVVPPEYRGRFRCEERRDGYRVIRTWLYATPNEGVIKKTLGHLSFMVTSVLLGLRPLGPIDVVVVSSPTFFSIFSGLLIARIKRACFIVEVRDLWPAIFVELGVLKSRIAIRILEALELSAYRQASAVVVVTEGFRENLVSRGVLAEKVHTIPNGVDLQRFRPIPGDHAQTRKGLGARLGDALVLYIGAHGISHGLISVADSAAKLTGEPIHFAFVGEGAAKRELADRVSELGLGNVSLHPGVPSDDVPELIASADLCLVPLRDLPLFGTFIPSKMFEYLAMGKAVIGAVSGESASILRDSGAMVVDPEDSAALVEAITRLAESSEVRSRMGKCGRAFVAAHFDREVLAHRYRQLLAERITASAEEETAPPG